MKGVGGGSKRKAIHPFVEGERGGDAFCFDHQEGMGSDIPQNYSTLFIYSLLYQNFIKLH